MGFLQILTLIGIAIGITIESYEVIGVNNQTVVTRVNVTNTEPSLKAVVLNSNQTPSNELDLNPGGTITVNCTGYVWDPNGASDITNVNATIYDYSEGMGTTEDNNYRYINKSCGSCLTVTSTNSSCTCRFSVWYYANNASWQCNMTVADSYNFTSQNISNNMTINTVVGMNVPTELDFGNMSVTETTSTPIPLNMTNYGNVPINFSLRGWGGTNAYSTDYNDTALICEIGNISNYYERYAINTSVNFGNMTNITNSSSGIPNFDIPVRTNDTVHGNASNETYWRIYIPPSIAGFCNGTLQFTAEETIM